MTAKIVFLAGRWLVIGKDVEQTFHSIADLIHYTHLYNVTIDNKDSFDFSGKLYTA